MTQILIEPPVEAAEKPKTMKAALAIAGAAGELGFGPRTMLEALEFAKLICATDFVPKTLRGNPGAVLAAIQTGAELGIGPMQSLQGVAVINGRPSIYGDLGLALIRRSGLLVEQVEKVETTKDGMTATCSVLRLGDRSPIIGSFSEAQAKRAHLWGKQGPWTEYPDRMMLWRARWFAWRAAFPDVLHGISGREEMEDVTRAQLRPARVYQEISQTLAELPEAVVAPTRGVAALAAAVLSTPEPEIVHACDSCQEAYSTAEELAEHTALQHVEVRA